jgi:hypothetical protein
MDTSPPTIPSPPRGTYLLTALVFPVGMTFGALVIPPLFHRLGWNPARGLFWQDGIYWVLAAGVAWLALVCFGMVAMARAHPVARGVLVVMCAAAMYAMLLAPDPKGLVPTTEQKIFRVVFALPPTIGAVWLLHPKYRRACKEYREARGW